MAGHKAMCPGTWGWRAKRLTLWVLMAGRCSLTQKFISRLLSEKTSSQARTLARRKSLPLA